jgi:enamine deaminase RidA (YjgF/YER057c/UK114 family)
MSGQVGMDPDGKLETGFAAQAERAWSNLFAILRAAGMEKRHLVKVTYFLIRPTDLPVLREIRDRVLEGNAPAATLLFVAALATPDLLIEIEAVAAR